MLSSTATRKVRLPHQVTVTWTVCSLNWRLHSTNLADCLNMTTTKLWGWECWLGPLMIHVKIVGIVVLVLEHNIWSLNSFDLLVIAIWLLTLLVVLDRGEGFELQLNFVCVLARSALSINTIASFLTQLNYIRLLLLSATMTSFMAVWLIFMMQISD